MLEILAVEDAENWQEFYRGLGQELQVGVQVTDNLEEALAKIAEQRFAAYILDGSFPRTKGGAAEQLWVELAERIKVFEGTYDKIFLVSGGVIWKQARRMGLQRLYDKGIGDEKEGVKSATDNIACDLKPLLKQ
ncbi:hypothetical protein HY637_01900 [Candidatus Woesearchaeota archaeon]|nr:hypothetical protein [Candidatus Woesearchaeota archaeon]